MELWCYFLVPKKWPKINGAHWGYNPLLVGGWTNPFETWKWSSNWIIIPKNRGKTSKTIVGKPPPSWYCWCKNSCTCWYGEYPIVYRVLYIQTVAVRDFFHQPYVFFSWGIVFIFHLLVTPMETTPGSVLPEVLWLAPPSGGNPPAPWGVKRWCRWCVRMTAGS